MILDSQAGSSSLAALTRTVAVLTWVQMIVTSATGRESPPPTAVKRLVPGPLDVVLVRLDDEPP
jgi:hypothetical protein